MSFIRCYMRASTASQDATRAKDLLTDFATSHGYGHGIASFYVENESGRKLKRPALMRLLGDATPNDVLLVESVDRLTRLTSSEWKVLKNMIQQKGLSIVAVDLPTSYKVLQEDLTDDMTKGILDAVNNMLIDVLATMSCRDFEQRKARTAMGISNRKAKLGKDAYKGRPENTERNNGIAKMLDGGMTYSQIQKATGASRATIAKIKKRNEEQALAG